MTDNSLSNAELLELQSLVSATSLPEELSHKITNDLLRLQRMNDQGNYSAEFEVTSHYIRQVCKIPFGKRVENVVDLNFAKDVLNKHHYGMQKVKDRVIEYLAVVKLLANSNDTEAIMNFRSSVLFLVGLPGIGKTTVARSIAEALGRPFVRIPMGGMGSAQNLRGLNRSMPQSAPGAVIKELCECKVLNPVILFDEIDRVSPDASAEIMGVLLELLDPEQNSSFTDYYIDYPVDLSECVMICSGNKTGGVANAVLDRLEVIEMPSYTQDEKIHIGREYLLPRELLNAGLTKDQVIIDDDTWSAIIRPLNFDAGIRTLDRTIQGICRKVAVRILAGEGPIFHLDTTNIKEFLPTY